MTLYKSIIGGEMKTVAFLQNMWTKNPKVTNGIVAMSKDPMGWNRLVKRLLFAGCKTGRVLKSTFKELADEMIYEECTKEIADNPKTICKPDPEHIREALERINPDVVITFGNHAYKFVSKEWTGLIIKCPHPAARQPETVSKLISGYEQLKRLKQNKLIGEAG